MFELWLGKFDKEDFIWKTVKSFDNYEDAYKFYKSYIQELVSASDEDLLELHESTRLDIELRDGDKKINWTGIYVREHNKEEENKND